MKKVLLFAPMGSVHRSFNKANIIALKELGLDITLLGNFEETYDSSGKITNYINECKKKGITIISRKFERHSLVKNFKYIPEIKKIVLDGGFSIIHAHTETGGLLLRLALSKRNKKKANISTVYTPHGMSFYKGSSFLSHMIYKPIERWICSLNEANISINKEEYDWLKKWNEKSAFFVHGIGLDLNKIENSAYKQGYLREELKIHKDKVLIVSVGELNENKNHSIVIRALKELPENIEYVICGEGKLHNHLQELSKSMRVSERLHLLGYRNDVYNILKEADIFVFPSFHEGLPVSVMEAMACGLPVIASDIRGCNDLVINGINGFLFNPNDDVRLARNIKKSIDNQHQQKEFIDNSKRIVRNYSLQSVCNELRKIYELCL